MTYSIGFTGTKEGMTEKQKGWVRSFLFYLVKPFPPEEEKFFHHGDCVGADFEAHTIACSWGFNIVIHPPVLSKYRAYSDQAPDRTEGTMEVRHCFQYLTRNKHIVDESDILLVTPKTEFQQLRSGTWAAYRYAKKQKKDTLIIFPSGRIDTEV